MVISAVLPNTTSLCGSMTVSTLYMVDFLPFPVFRFFTGMEGVFITKEKILFRVDSEMFSCITYSKPIPLSEEIICRHSNFMNFSITLTPKPVNGTKPNLALFLSDVAYCVSDMKSCQAGQSRPFLARADLSWPEPPFSG